MHASSSLYVFVINNNSWTHIHIFLIDVNSIMFFHVMLFICVLCSERPFFLTSAPLDPGVLGTCSSAGVIIVTEPTARAVLIPIKLPWVNNPTLFCYYLDIFLSLPGCRESCSRESWEVWSWEQRGLSDSIGEYFPTCSGVYPLLYHRNTPQVARGGQVSTLFLFPELRLLKRYDESGWTLVFRQSSSLLALPFLS